MIRNYALNIQFFNYFWKYIILLTNDKNDIEDYNGSVNLKTREEVQ